MSHSHHDFVKLVVRLPIDAPASAETLWAQPVGVFYRLKNVPIWAYGMAYDDLVVANGDADGRLYVTSVAESSGLLTLRLAGPNADADQFRALVQWVGANSIATEHFSDSYSAFALDEPAFLRIEHDLVRSESGGLISFEIANRD